MDQGLFTKHLQTITVRNDIKQRILDLITEKTGVSLNEKEIEISKKRVLITTSSVKRATLLKKKIQEILIEAGYTLKN